MCLHLSCANLFDSGHGWRLLGGSGAILVPNISLRVLVRSYFVLVPLIAVPGFLPSSGINDYLELSSATSCSAVSDCLI